MSADSPRRTLGNASRGMVAVPSIVPPQVVSDRSILDSAIGFINEVTLAHQPHTDPKDTITWARFETAADISDPRYGDDWELEGNVAPPLLLILGYGLGVQVWAIPANGEAVEVLSWRHGIVSALRVLPTPSASVAIEENGRADEPVDAYAEKRPLIALVDGSPSSGSQPQFCAVNFISLKTGTQVKTIKFKNPVIDVLANRSSIVITFHERIAVFDARTLEDRLSITTCYPSPGINPNPVALGHRWLAYAEHKLIHSKRSGGGCDGEGVASYTATVLNASKSLVKGLRELGEQVAAGLTGTSASGTSSKNTSFDSGTGPESKQSGVVTIIDIKNPLRDYSPTSGVPMSSSGSSAGTDPMVAHFIAHSEALVAMEFDNTGMLLLTADRRGHDFHVFRIQPNPVGPSLAAVHHLYVLHRGDTSAKVQNISFSLDSRWVAVSTLRGTTHVFPITPYGGPMGVRTHTSLHVVNKLSRFHRSAGLSAEGRSNSPISHSESTTFSLSLQPYHNPTLPPYPRPTVVMPLAQLRQPFALGSPPGSATLAGGKSVAAGQGTGSQRQRLSSLSDDSGKPLSVCAIFAKSRSWLLDPPNVTREAPHRMQRKAVDSLFVMAGHGALIQYDLDTKLASNVAKERICDDTPIELEVEAKAQWNLGRRKEGSQEIMPPLTLDNWLVKSRNSCMLTDSTRQYDDSDDRGESWLAQVEIVTHAGPHRRLWMGPQFVFKTYNTPSGSNLSHVDIEAVEIGTNSKAATTSAAAKAEHSSPLNMPLTAAGRSSAVPVLIESGSYSSIEQSPKLMDRFRHDHLDSDFAVAHGDTRLKEDLADAMRESPSVSAASKDSGGRGCETTITGCSNDNIAFYDALADYDEDQDQEAQDHESVHNRNASAAALASALPNIYSYDNSSSYESMESLVKKPPQASIEKIVNPLGTVTTVTSCLAADVKTDILDEVVSQLAAEDTIIHENCDESLFRPVVAIFCDEKTRLQQEEDERKSQELCQPPENIGNNLVVPVIEKEVDDELNKKEKQKNSSKFQRSAQQSQQQRKFEELSSLNRKSKNEFPTKGEGSNQEPEYVKKESQMSRVKEIRPEDRVQVEESTATKSLDAQDSKEMKETIKAKESKNVLSKVKESKIEELTKTLPKLEVKVKESESSSLEPLNEPDCFKKKSKSEGMAKEKLVKTVCDDAKTKQLKSELKAKESIKASTGAKAKKLPKSKESTPERELSPPKLVSKQTDKALRCDDESEEELPMEFKKMTPAKEEDKKAMPQQILTKKEIKKQQQKVEEEIDKHKVEFLKEIEKEQTKAAVKVLKEQKNFEESTKSKMSDGNKIESDIKKELSLQDKKTKEILGKGEKKKVSDDSKTVDKVEKEEASEPRNKSTAACEITDSTIDKCKPQVKESSTDGKELPETAVVDIQISAINKTAIKEEIKRTPTVAKSTKTDITKPAKAETSKTIVKTEQLNVKDLADSLIELQAEEVQCDVDKPKEKPTTPVLETVDIFTAPTIKLSKKNKKKANKSGSSSETDEVVDIVKSDVKSRANPALKKKSSFSSEQSYADLADSLLERKDVDLKDTMFISFTQIEERNKLQEKNKAKQAESEQELSEKSTKIATASKAATPDKKDSGKKRPENTLDSLPKLKSNSATTTSAAAVAKKDLKLEKESEEGKTISKTKQREDKCLLKDVKQSKAGVSDKRNEELRDHSDASSKSLQFKGDTLMDTKKTAKNEEFKENTEKKVEDSEEPAISKLEKNNVVKFSLSRKEECKEMEKNAEEITKCKAGERSKEQDPKKPLENLKKNEEKCEKNVKQTTENIKKNKESSSTAPNKSSGNEDSNKDKSIGKISNPDENEKKKADASKKLDEKKIDCENSEEKRKDSIKNVKETPEELNTSSENKSKIEDSSPKKDKKCLQDSKIPLIDKEMKISEKDKAKVIAVSKSKDSKVDEVKNLEIKSAMANEKSSQPLKGSDAKIKSDDKDVKKLDTKKTLEMPKSILSAETDVIVEQPRRQQNKELEKEIIKHHDKKDTKAIEKKGNVGDEDDVSLKPLALPPMPPRKNDNKASNVEDVKKDSIAKKTHETITPKEIPSKPSKKKPEENVHFSSPMTIKPLSASKAEAKNQTTENPRNKDEVHKNKIPESLPSDASKKPLTSIGKTLTSPLPSPSPPPIASAWTTLSGAEMIAQNLCKETKPDDAVFPSLGAIAKSPKSGSQKLLPELPTPRDVKEPPNSKKSKATSSLDDFPTLHALEPLPPLPSLEPLELLGESKKDVSLINFESPLSENPAVERKITPPPRGFTDQNLIFALCGSLHYENEQRTHATVDKSDASSSNRSSLAMDEPSMADYKSLTENDDPYVSLEQSSQDTNTTNTHTTNDKFSSSNNSSGTEEIIIMEEKKMTKKQKRKRQQQLLELQTQKDSQNKDNADLDDEELRPLIAMSESQVDNIADRMMGSVILPSLLDESFTTKPRPMMAKSNALTHSTTTDSEGPMPATTSDDNVFIMPSNSGHTQHKIKTKKMEHKFNLIAAIEAATSSSTSSAEESGVEVADDSPPPMTSAALMSAVSGLSPTGGASPALPTPMSPVVVGAPQVAASLGCSTVGALKKKTKRPFQFHKDQQGGDCSNDTTDGMNKMRNQLNHKKSTTTDLNNSNHDSNTTPTTTITTTTTTTSSVLKQKPLNMKSLSKDTNLPPQATTETHKSIYEMKQQQQQQQQQQPQQQQLQYLTCNAMDNCFASPENTNHHMDSATIVNIDIFDDQLSTSSLSNTSRFSCEAAPLTTTTPPISLNGVIDANLMHFSQNTKTAAAKAKGAVVVELEGDGCGDETDMPSALNDNKRLTMRLRRQASGGSGASAEEDDQDDDDDNSSNGSAGSL